MRTHSLEKGNVVVFVNKSQTHGKLTLYIYWNYVVCVFTRMQSEFVIFLVIEFLRTRWLRHKSDAS